MNEGMLERKTTKCHTIGTAPTSNRKIAEIDKIDTLTHNYMTALVHGLRLVLWAQICIEIRIMSIPFPFCFLNYDLFD